jgi:hypothetical protein
MPPPMPLLAEGQAGIKGLSAAAAAKRNIGW